MTTQSKAPAASVPFFASVSSLPFCSRPYVAAGAGRVTRRYVRRSTPPRWYALGMMTHTILLLSAFAPVAAHVVISHRRHAATPRVAAAAATPTRVAIVTAHVIVAHPNLAVVSRRAAYASPRAWSLTSVTTYLLTYLLTPCSARRATPSPRQDDASPAEWRRRSPQWSGTAPPNSVHTSTA